MKAGEEAIRASAQASNSAKFCTIYSSSQADYETMRKLCARNPLPQRRPRLHPTPYSWEMTPARSEDGRPRRGFGSSSSSFGARPSGASACRHSHGCGRGGTLARSLARGGGWIGYVTENVVNNEEDGDGDTDHEGYTIRAGAIGTLNCIR